MGQNTLALQARIIDAQPAGLKALTSAEMCLAKGLKKQADSFAKNISHSLPRPLQKGATEDERRSCRHQTHCRIQKAEISSSSTQAIRKLLAVSCVFTFWLLLEVSGLCRLESVARRAAPCPRQQGPMEERQSSGNDDRRATSIQPALPKVITAATPTISALQT